MNKKFMSKLLLGIMGFVILNLFEMQATNLALPFFHPFSTPLSLSHFSKLDYVYYSIHNCIENKFIMCMQTLKSLKNQNFKHGVCVSRSLLVTAF